MFLVSYWRTTTRGTGISGMAWPAGMDEERWGPSNKLSLAWIFTYTDPLLVLWWSRRFSICKWNLCHWVCPFLYPPLFVSFFLFASFLFASFTTSITHHCSFALPPLTNGRKTQAGTASMFGFLNKKWYIRLISSSLLQKWRCIEMQSHNGPA